MISFFKSMGLTSVFSNPDNPKIQEPPQRPEPQTAVSWEPEIGLSSISTLGVLLWSAKSFSSLVAAKGSEVMAIGALKGTTVVAGTSTAYVGFSFSLGCLIGIGINYLPQTLGYEKTVGDHLGDGMTELFGPADRNGNFFKACEFLGLA